MTNGKRMRQLELKCSLDEEVDAKTIDKSIPPGLVWTIFGLYKHLLDNEKKEREEMSSTSDNLFLTLQAKLDNFKSFSATNKR